MGFDTIEINLVVPIDCSDAQILREGYQKKTDYFVTLIKRVGRYLAEITIS